MAFLRQIRWGQVLFGAVAALLLADLWQRAEAGRLREIGTAGRLVGLFVAAVAFWIYLNNQYKHGLVPDYSRTCRHCLGPVNRYSEFCEHCGADLIAEEKLVRCPRCEAEVYDGTKFCPECGGAIGKPQGKKAKKAKAEPEPKEGWDAPVDAVTGFPPDERR